MTSELGPIVVLAQPDRPYRLNTRKTHTPRKNAHRQHVDPADVAEEEVQDRARDRGQALTPGEAPSRRSA